MFWNSVDNYASKPLYLSRYSFVVCTKLVLISKCAVSSDSWVAGKFTVQWICLDHCCDVMDCKYKNWV